MTALAHPEPAPEPDDVTLTPEQQALLARFVGPVELLQAWHVARGWGAVVKSLTITFDPAAERD